MFHYEAMAHLAALQFRAGTSGELEATQAQAAVELAQVNLAAQLRARAQS